MSSPPLLDRFERDGFVMLPDVFDAESIDGLATRLAVALESDTPTVLRSRGETYGSRDLISLLPEVGDIPRRPALQDFVTSVLGPTTGLVRALYFDKPPNRAWSLPWHKDRTIAVKDNRLPTSYFRRPTVKAGIPHVEAPEALLQRMLSLRLHLDPMSDENGPLCVLPGSHRDGAGADRSPVELRSAAGDVLAMRPLLSHSSRLPREGTTMHRRVIHLELASSKELPDGYEWYRFICLDAG